MKEIIEAIHSYKIPLLNINFINRENETKNILKILEEFPLKSWIYVITGPWGCGKSEWLRALTFALNIIKEKEYDVLYIDLTEKELEKFYSSTKEDIREIIEDMVKAFFGERVRIPWYIYKIVKTLYEKKKLKGKSLLLIFDEITYSIGKKKREIEAFINSLGQKLVAISQEYNTRAFSFVITSEQVATEYFASISGKLMSTYLLWNLEKKAFMQLAEKLQSLYKNEFLWKLLGGILEH